MEEINEKISIQQKAFSEDDNHEKDKYDKEIDLIIRREEVMNSVLEKLIDKLNNQQTRSDSSQL